MNRTQNEFWGLQVHFANTFPVGVAPMRELLDLEIYSQGWIMDILGQVPLRLLQMLLTNGACNTVIPSLLPIPHSQNLCKSPDTTMH